MQQKCFTDGFQKWFFILLLNLVMILPCFALDPEPRKWSHLPMDTDFGGFGFAYTTADIFFDPNLLLENVEMNLATFVGKYIHTFELFNSSARIDVSQAYQKGSWTGLLDGVSASTTRSGLSDTIVRIAINILGAPPLRGKDFEIYRANKNIETIVGTALVIRLPTGDYMEDKLINLGQNRFAFRPQLGFTHTRGKWVTELTGEVAFYTENDDFFNGNKLEQDPLYIVHGHLIRNFKPGQWASISLGYDHGGENIFNGIGKGDKKQNIAWKLSYAYPINRSMGMKISYVGTRTQELTGFDSESLAAGMSFVW